MKPLPAITAALLAALLVLTPALASASGTITITSPPPGTAVTGQQAVTVSGTVSPAASGINVGVTVTNPLNVQVLQYNAPTDPTTGGWSFGFEAGTSNQWTSGTYTISATAPGYSSAQATFSYTSTTPSSSFNETKILLEILGNVTLINSEIHTINTTLTTLSAAQAAQGVTIGEINSALGALSGVPTQLTSITGTLTTMSGNIGTIQSGVSGLATSVGTLQSDINSITTTLNGIPGTLSSILTAAQGAQTSSGTAATSASSAQTAASAAQTAATNASNAVSSTQTYVLAVAVLAAITLVLELAILVRKLS